MYNLQVQTKDEEHNKQEEAFYLNKAQGYFFHKKKAKTKTKNSVFFH